MPVGAENLELIRGGSKFEVYFVAGRAHRIIRVVPKPPGSPKAGAPPRFFIATAVALSQKKVQDARQ